MSYENDDLIREDVQEESSDNSVEKSDVEALEAENESTDKVDQDSGESQKSEGQYFTADEVSEKIKKRVDRANAKYESLQKELEEKQALINEMQKNLEENSSSDDEDAVIERKLLQMQQKAIDAQRKRLVSQKAQNFMDNLSSGKERFQDFEDVLCSSKLNFSDAMLRGAAEENDPADFLYVAAKHHASELDRIYKMADSDKQTFAMVRLAEKISAGKRRKANVSGAPQPINNKGGGAQNSTHSGDLTDYRAFCAAYGIDG